MLPGDYWESSWLIYLKLIKSLSSTARDKMAQSKLNDFAGKFAKGGPPGLATGIKMLAALGATAYGISQSLYTGKL